MVSTPASTKTKKILTMNAKASNCSVLTLVETAGLRRSLDEKLSGPRGAFWLSALKRLDRKENPWIPFEKVLEIKEDRDPADSVSSYLARLKTVDILPFDGVTDYINSLNEDIIPNLSLTTNFEAYDIVKVSVGDLLTLQERGKFTYFDVLEKASEHGFEKCSFYDGIVAITKLVEASIKNNGNGGGFIVCMDLIRETKLPHCHSWPRKTERQGFFTFYDMKIKSQVLHSSNLLEDPSQFLLLKSPHQ